MSVSVCFFFITGCKLLFRAILPSGTGKNIVHKKDEPNDKCRVVKFLAKRYAKDFQSKLFIPVKP